MVIYAQWSCINDWLTAYYIATFLLQLLHFSTNNFLVAKQVSVILAIIFFQVWHFSQMRYFSINQSFIVAFVNST